MESWWLLDDLDLLKDKLIPDDVQIPVVDRGLEVGELDDLPAVDDGFVDGAIGLIGFLGRDLGPIPLRRFDLR